MNVVVCIKQVPQDLCREISEAGDIDRLNGNYCINPADLYALEAGLRIKEQLESKVVAITMGSERSQDILRQAAALGVDELILLTDKQFAGADTMATSYVLAKAIQKIGNVRAVICGKETVDGSTGQVASELAQKLLFSYATNVSKIDINNETFIYERFLDGKVVRGIFEGPALFSVNRLIGECRVATIKGILAAEKKKIYSWGAGDIEAEGEKCGSRGSYTKVRKVFENSQHKGKSEEWIGTNKEIARKLQKLIDRENKKSINENEEIPDIRYELFMNSYKEFGDEVRNNICIFAEVEAGSICESAFQMISKMSRMDEQSSIAVIIIAEKLPYNFNKAFAFGAKEIYFVKANVRSIGNEKFFSEILKKLIKKIHPQIFLTAASDFGRSLAPYLASDLQMGLTADCVDFYMDGEKLIQVRPVYGGKNYAEIVSVNSSVQMATVRPNVFKAEYISEPYQKGVIYEIIGCNTTVPLESIDVIEEKKGVDHKRIIFIGGRGLESERGFNKLKEAAACVGASIGATRVAVDLKWAGYENQVGLTGSNLQGNLAVLFGVSGAAEHIAGLRNVGMVVAINNDEAAEIFNFSDVKIVADAKEVLAAFDSLLNMKEEKKNGKYYKNGK